MNEILIKTLIMNIDIEYRKEIRTRIIMNQNF